jgi:hypothetical protein
MNARPPASLDLGQPISAFPSANAAIALRCCVMIYCQYTLGMSVQHRPAGPLAGVM